MLNIFKRLAGSEKDIADTYHGETDIGKVRRANEDFFRIDPEKKLFIAADGMGGHNAGEVASLNATNWVNKYLSADLLSKIEGNNERIRQEMIKSLLFAHRGILEISKKKVRLQGMGCTIVAALVKGQDLHVSHVGDARAYVCTNSSIKLLTTDHSYVMAMVKRGEMTLEEARNSPKKNKIIQAIGVPEQIMPEYTYHQMARGDKLLLCSDGLWDMLSDKSIHKIVKKNKPAKSICEKLVKMANKAGGKDNITAVVAKF